MFWYRAEAGSGNFSVVGTTVKDPEKPEKHTRLNGERRYIATTAGEDCILSAHLLPNPRHKRI